MKKLILSLTILLISTFIFAENINVKNVVFNVHFNIPSIHINRYTFKKLEDNLNYKNTSLKVLNRELAKYPYNILKNYIPKDIYIVDDCYNINSTAHINGLSNEDLIILRYKVLNIKYYTNVLHHEIFHSIIGNSNLDIVNKMLKFKLDEICNYDEITLQNDYTQFNANFITNYHPDFEETCCEMFSLLMYNDLTYKKNLSIPAWLIRYNDNYKLKKKFKILIEFTKYISNNKMDLNFYYTTNN